MLQSAGYWYVLASFFLIPLSWVALAATLVVAAVLESARLIRR